MDCILRFIITDGTDYATDSNALTFSSNKNDAFMWSTLKAVNSVLETARNRKKGGFDKFYVETIKWYSVEVEPDIKMDIDTIRQFIDIVEDCAHHKGATKALYEKYHNKMLDIEHFIEGTDLNARDGYKAYKKLQLTRQYRRAYKNRCMIQDAINSLGIDVSVLKKLVTQFDTMVYKPKEIDLDTII